MASNGIALIPIAIALVAIIVPIGANAVGLSTYEKKQYEILKEGLLPPDEVGKILHSLDENTKIGGLSVRDILELAENSDGAAYFDYCEYDAISRHVRDVMDNDTNVFLNVFEFANPKMMSCRQNVIQIYRDNRRLVELREKDLSTDKVGEILLAIEDKDNVKVGKLTIRTILGRTSKRGLLEEDCKYDAVARRNLNRIDSDENSILNAYKYANANHFPEMLPFCAEKIKRIFRDNVTLGKLREANQTKAETEKILNTIEDKDNVFVGGSSVQTILELASKSSTSFCTCLDDELVRRKYFEDDDRNLVRNVALFDEARDKFLEFCGSNFDRVLQLSLEDVSQEDKQEIKSFYVLTNSSGNDKTNLRSVASESSIGDRCKRFYESYNVLEYIWTKYQQMKSRRNNYYSNYSGLSAVPTELQEGCSYYHNHISPVESRRSAGIFLNHQPTDDNN